MNSILSLLKVILFIGPPGCGKGTLASALCSMKSAEFAHVSTGDLLRNEVNNKTKRGLLIKDLLSKGELINDGLVFDLLKDRFGEMPRHYEKSIILDGFPRTFEQALMLDSLIQDQQIHLSMNVYFDISYAALLKRILGRFSCEKCGELYNDFSKPTKMVNVCDKCSSTHFKRRSDDSEDVLKKRHDLYLQETIPLLDYYKDSLITIDASKGIDDVKQDFMKHYLCLM